MRARGARRNTAAPAAARPARRRSRERPRHARRNERNLIGRDFSGLEARTPRRWLWPAALMMLLAAFALVRLRTEVLRLRYDLAHQIAREQALRDEAGALTVEMRRLRDPRALARRASALGFVRPEVLIDLPAAAGAVAVHAAHDAGGDAAARSPEGQP